MYLRHSKNVTSPLLFRKHIFFANMYKHLLDPFADNIKGRKIPFPPSLFSPNLPNRLTQQLISPSVFSIFGLFKYSHFFCCPPNSHEKERLKKFFSLTSCPSFPTKNRFEEKERYIFVGDRMMSIIMRSSNSKTNFPSFLSHSVTQRFRRRPIISLRGGRRNF